MDTVEYLIQQEKSRRAGAGMGPLSTSAEAEFRRQLIATLIIRGDAQAAIHLRPQNTTKQLNG